MKEEQVVQQDKWFNKLFSWIKKHRIDLTLYFGFLLMIVVLIILAVAFDYKDAIVASRPYDSIAFSVFGFDVAWYAIFILSGLIMAAIMAFMEFKRVGWKTDDLLDGILIIAPLSILGARFLYVLTSEIPFSDFLNFRDGGLAINGAIIVATISVILFSRFKKINVFVLADMLAIGFLMGQISGRWGNFMNAEAHGGLTSSKSVIDMLPNFITHQMGFSGSSAASAGSIYQPTFLYESLWNLLGVTILFVLRRKRIFKAGDILGIYLIWYGFGRGVLIEPFRTDQLISFGIPVNILISLLFVAIGIIFLILKRVYIKEEPYYADVANKTDIVFFDKKVTTKKKSKNIND